MKRRVFIICILLIRVSISLYAQTGYSNLEFVENKGQWDNRIHFKAEINNGSFLLTRQGFSVVLRDAADMEKIRNYSHGMAPASIKQPVRKLPASNDVKIGLNKNVQSIIHSHLYEVSFLNANENVEIMPDKPLPTYNNYFIGNDPHKWASNCQIYQGVTYRNIYPNIDLRYYTDNDNGMLKYDLIVHPGADPNQIIMKYRGASKLSIKDNHLITHTSVGDVKEFVPRSFQTNESGRTELECKYILGSDSTIRFRVSNYSKDATLIIDPTLVFSTFTGSRSDNWGYTATYDNSGNFYSGSIVLDDHGSGSYFGATPGAFQTSFQGGDGSEGAGFGYDVGIMKFNSRGTNRVYATYIGGKGDEQPHSLFVDNAGNLVVAGRTSSSDFPSTQPTFGNGGSFDIFITKLNASGSGIIGSRKFGGKGWDGVNIAPKYLGTPIPMGQNSLRLNYGDDGRSEVVLDGANNIYLASCTQSDDFLCTPNAFQTKRAGKQDGVFIKTNPDLSVVLASTYLGGNGDDAAFVLALNPTNNDIYIAGGTASTNLPGTGNGPVLYNTLQGDIDGFISIISNDGGTLRKTSYLGTNGTEVIFGVQFDKFGYPYVMGTTTGAWPVVNAAWSQKGGKQFISKLQPDLSNWVYSTTFGKGDVYPDISPTAFLVDRCENVYVSGWGGGIETEDIYVYHNSTTSGLSVTPDAYQKNTDGADFYFFVLKKNATAQLYGSFYGQNGGFSDHVDGGTSRFDRQGIIYEAICANCFGGATFPTTPGAWSRVNGTGSNGCNLAAVKIAFNFAGVAADLRSMINGRYDSSGCVPLNTLLTDTIHNAKMYVWNFGDGTPDTMTTSNQVNHLYNNIGTYPVRLIAIDSSTCNIADTVYIHIRARNDKADLAFNAAKLPPCQSLTYQFDNVSVPPAGKPFGPNTFTWDFGDGSAPLVAGNPTITHAFPSPGTYNVSLLMLDTSYCNYPDSAQKTLRIAPVVKAQFDVLSGCAPYNAQFNNTSVAGLQFAWDFGDGSTSTDFNPVHLYTDTGAYTIHLTVYDSTTCNKVDSTSRSIFVHTKPQAAFTDQPVPPQINTPTVFTNNSTAASQFKWFFGDGDTLFKATRNIPDTVIHQYESTATFQACLVAYNQFGCTDTTCAPVQALINPLLDVPNAFTPGRFGQNSIIRVRGFGIGKMTFRIYNRWGQKVFESNNPDYGWDGNFNGKPQPMDVYAYTLDAVFFDGKKITKTGDITLIR
ncbi:MAG: hypothetical protein C5B59_13615 [Bacteroidetes bacterium]|nr:MAG: hypothetical protein C5B59_13615 [Bacteroidota bacterium]